MTEVSSSGTFVPSTSRMGTSYFPSIPPKTPKTALSYPRFVLEAPYSALMGVVVDGRIPDRCKTRTSTNDVTTITTKNNRTALTGKCVTYEQNQPRPGEYPINAIDKACHAHDVAYSRSNNLQQRHLADVNLIHALNAIPDKSLKEKLASRYKQAEPLKTKTSTEVASAFERIYRRGPLRWPNLLQVDPGKDIYLIHQKKIFLNLSSAMSL
ncbi:hypothetical protein ACJMK2_006905 [Sinanodonta woodiana]|uniref:Phospholipase A2-like domain-containing protein n=1 Tax=Sinanodonta woodiana TaxID=1069815 RepID=A0ABD3VUN3_SINWO